MSESVCIYFDTEFTDFGIDSDLLSIGFVAATTDDELYIEITDPHPQCQPSEFVREFVLPLFGRHRPERLTRTQAAIRIDQWLDGLRGGDRETPIAFVSDSVLDWQYLMELWVSMPGEPSWAAARNIRGMLAQSTLMPHQTELLFAHVDEYHQERQEQHHALVDARALKMAMDRVRW